MRCLSPPHLKDWVHGERGLQVCAWRVTGQKRKELRFPNKFPAQASSLAACTSRGTWHQLALRELCLGLGGPEARITMPSLGRAVTIASYQCRRGGRGRGGSAGVRAPRPGPPGREALGPRCTGHDLGLLSRSTSWPCHRRSTPHRAEARRGRLSHSDAVTHPGASELVQSRGARMPSAWVTDVRGDGEGVSSRGDGEPVLALQALLLAMGFSSFQHLGLPGCRVGPHGLYGLCSVIEGITEK